jgi:hypothetical protein
MGVERRISGVTVCCSSATRRSVQVSFRGTTHTRAVTCRKCIGLLQEMAQREDAQKERLRDRALLGGPKDWKGHSTL